MINYFPMELVGDDAQAVIQCVNQGIDSRLTAFTRSTFEWRIHSMGDCHFSLEEWQLHHKGNYGIEKLHCRIHPDEMEVLLRRLNDLGDEGNEYADSLADSIVYVEYGVEVI
jgi:hypothetical protein